MVNKYKNSRHKRSRKRTVILLFVIILALIVGGYFAYRAFWPNSEQNLAPQNQPNQQEAPEVPATVQDNELESKIAAWAATQPGVYAVHVEELDNAVDANNLRTASYRASEQMVPASTYKVFVAYAVLREIEQGKYTLETTARNGKTIAANLEDMIVNSGNDSGRALGFLLGWRHINAMLADIGITDTDLYNYVEAHDEPVGDKYTTAADSGKLLKGIFNGSLLNETHKTLLLDLMERQVWRERIASGVPDGVVVATKPGWLEGVQSDIGIVYGPVSTYSISIYSTAASPAPLAELSRLVYEALNQ